MQQVGVDRGAKGGNWLLHLVVSSSKASPFTLSELHPLPPAARAPPAEHWRDGRQHRSHSEWRRYHPSTFKKQLLSKQEYPHQAGPQPNWGESAHQCTRDLGWNLLEHFSTWCKARNWGGSREWVSRSNFSSLGVPGSTVNLKSNHSTFVLRTVGDQTPLHLQQTEGRDGKESAVQSGDLPEGRSRSPQGLKPSLWSCYHTLNKCYNVLSGITLKASPVVTTLGNQPTCVSIPAPLHAVCPQAKLFPLWVQNHL